MPQTHHQARFAVPEGRGVRPLLRGPCVLLCKCVGYLRREAVLRRMPVLECLADVIALRQAQGRLFRQERGRIGHRLFLLLARCRLLWLLAVDFRLEHRNCAGLELRFDGLCAMESCRIGGFGLGYSMQPVEGVTLRGECIDVLWR
jgi:hypothetical protein